MLNQWPKRGTPSIRANHLSEREREAARSVRNNLSAMSEYVDAFEDALSLFDWCEAEAQKLEGAKHIRTRMRLRSWQVLAARDGAMSIFHFGKAMEGVGKVLHRCPTVKASVDLLRAKSARKLFQLHFSRHVAIRHTVAHAAEMHATPEGTRLNSFSGDAADLGLGDPSRPVFAVGRMENISVSSSLFGRTFAATYEGKLLQYEVDRTTFLHLNAVREEFFAAFPP